MFIPVKTPTEFEFFLNMKEKEQFVKTNYRREDKTFGKCCHYQSCSHGLTLPR
jgi:hypothetical protein